MTVVDLPLLEMQPLPINRHEQRCFEDWLAGGYDAVVVVSPTAASLAMAYYQHHHQRHLPVTGCQQSPAVPQGVDSDGHVPCHHLPKSPIIAVGQATAAVLQQGGWQVQTPESETNEGMLVMDAIAGLQAGQRLLVWRGVGGRRHLVDCLHERGVHSDAIVWYQRQLPAAAAATYQQWLATSTLDQQRDALVLISSGEAFANWQQIVSAATAEDTGHSPHLADFYYLVLGQRLATLLATQQLSHSRLTDLTPDHITDVLQQLMA